MSATAFFGIVVPAWIVIGLVTAAFMGSRGHALYPWLVLGAVFGPLVIPLMIESRRRARGASPWVLESGVPGRGTIDVLVGIDGSPHSVAALRAVCMLLGRRLGRLTVATVLDYDTVDSAQGQVEEQKAEAELAEVCHAFGRRAERVILRGKPAEALAKHAIEGEYELIAVGSKGRGLSKHLAGSVATTLASDAPVPVLLAGH